MFFNTNYKNNLIIYENNKCNNNITFLKQFFNIFFSLEK